MNAKPKPTAAVMHRLWSKGVFACKADPRFSYCHYIPPGFDEAPDDHTLLVVIHGSIRNATDYRDAFSAFARYNKCVVLAPLFPIGVLGDDNADGYKYLREGEIRYDQILLKIIEEFAQAVGVPCEKFLLTGFSGGAHFAHRFFYRHPELLLAVSVGAPGGITRIDDSRDFWLGTRDFEARFGRALDLPAMRKVPVQLIVGACDVEEFTYPPELAAFVGSMGDIGKNRVERNALLYANYLEHGLNVRQEIIPKIAHDGLRAAPHVGDFFVQAIREASAS